MPDDVLVGGIGASVLMVIVVNMILSVFIPLEDQLFTFFFIFFIMVATLTSPLGMAISTILSLIFALLVAVKYYQ